jgi:diguanylate cyclase (GGDEF)-like protein
LRAELLNLKAKNPYIMDLLIIGADGRIQHWTGPGTPPDVSDRSYYSAHTQGLAAGLFVGPPQLSKVHADRWFFAMSQAARDDNARLSQVLVVIIDVALLRSRLGLRMALPESSQALLALDGSIYTRTPEHPKYVGKNISRQAEFDQLSQANPLLAFRRVSQLDGKERILSFRRLTDYPMIAAGTITLDYLLQSWRQRAGVVFLFWLALSLTILALARRADAISRRQAELATLDSLTGVYNRRTILDTAERLERSAEHAGKLSILMIDVDHFKSVNDNHGHAAGDAVLCEITRVLRAQIRATDFLGRYGGEEFLVLMPDTGPEGALKVAEKLRSTVEAGVRQPQPVTISIGVATTRESDTMLDRTLSRADTALYEAKTAGRNQVRLAA